MDYEKQISKVRNAKSSSEIKRIVLNRFKDNNYKLYQYCSFDESKLDKLHSYEDKSNYSYKNLLKKRIFASNPSNFNDPFDCVMGVSTNSVLNDFVKSFLNLSYINTRINKQKLKDLFSDVKNRSKNLKMIESWEPSIVRDLLIQMIKVDRIYNQLTTQHNKEYMKNDSIKYADKIRIMQDVINQQEFMSSFTENFLDIKYKNETTSKQLFQVFQNNHLLLKNMLADPVNLSFDSKNNVNELSVSIDKLNLLNDRIGSSSVEEEAIKLKSAIESIYEFATKGLNDLYDAIGKHFGITCFSKKSDIPLMWSHYSDKHTGFVVEYDISSLTDADADKLPFLMNVIYSKKRPSLDPIEIQALKNLKEHANIESLISRTMIDLMFTKSYDWRYEKEVRNLVYLENDDERFIQFKYVKSIILGVKSNDVLKKLMVDLCKKEEWELYEYVMHEDDYNLVLIKHKYI